MAIGCNECKSWIRVLQDKGLDPRPHPDAFCCGCGHNELRVYEALMAADKAQEEFEGYCEGMESEKARD